MNHHLQLSNANHPGKAFTQNLASESAPGKVTHDYRLTELEAHLVGEALILLAEIRSKALQLSADFSRKHDVVAPNVHDFGLPAIVALQRQFSEPNVLWME